MLTLLATGKKSVGTTAIQFVERSVTAAPIANTETKSAVAHLKLDDRISFWFKNSHTCRLCGSIHAQPRDHFVTGVEARHHATREIFLDYLLAEDNVGKLSGTSKWLSRLQARRMDTIALDNINLEKEERDLFFLDISSSSSSSSSSSTQVNHFSTESLFLRQQRLLELSVIEKRCQFLFQVFQFLKATGILIHSLVPAVKSESEIISYGKGILRTKSARNFVQFESTEYKGDSFYGSSSSRRLQWMLPHRDFLTNQHAWAMGILRDGVESNNNLAELGVRLQVEKLVPCNAILGGGENKAIADIIEAILGELHLHLIKLTTNPSPEPSISSLNNDSSSSSSLSSPKIYKVRFPKVERRQQKKGEQEDSSADGKKIEKMKKKRKKVPTRLCISGKTGAFTSNLQVTHPLMTGVCSSHADKALLAVIRFAIDEILDLAALTFAYSYVNAPQAFLFLREILHSQAKMQTEPRVSPAATQRPVFGRRLRKASSYDFNFFGVRLFKDKLQEDEFPEFHKQEKEKEEKRQAEEKEKARKRELLETPFFALKKIEFASASSSSSSSSSSPSISSSQNLPSSSSSSSSSSSQNVADALPSHSYLARSAAASGTFLNRAKYQSNGKWNFQFRQKSKNEEEQEELKSKIKKTNNHHHQFALEQHLEDLLQNSASLPLRPEPLPQSCFDELEEFENHASPTALDDLTQKILASRSIFQLSEFKQVDESRIFDPAMSFETSSTGSTGFIPDIVKKVEAKRLADQEKRKKMRMKRQI